MWRTLNIYPDLKLGVLVNANRGRDLYVQMKEIQTMYVSYRSSLYAVRFTFPNMAASYSCFYCTPACAQQGHDLPSSPWNPHITSCSIGLKTLVKFANVFWARAGFIFYISAVCPCFVSKTEVKVKYDCNRQCQDILTNLCFQSHACPERC